MQRSMVMLMVVVLSSVSLDASRMQKHIEEMRKKESQLPSMRREYDRLILCNPVDKISIQKIIDAHDQVGQCPQARLMEVRLKYTLSDQQKERSLKMQQYEAERQSLLVSVAKVPMVPVESDIKKSTASGALDTKVSVASAQKECR